MRPPRLEVWLSGAHAGQLTYPADAAPTFTYDPTYCHTGRGVPLSVSMPLDQPTHTGPVVWNWFDNLLPDNDLVRTRWADQLSTTTSPFDLLTHMGADCAGAVQVLPEGISPDDAEDLEPVTEQEIGERIERLHRDALAWEGSQPGRWSLGGFQSKFALARTSEGGWAAPQRRAPSTHIVKIGVAGLADSDIAEYATMRAGALLGLPVPPTVLAQFAGHVAIVIERFDRTARPDGRVQRWHQEDLCQVLGLGRTNKYEADGGPNLARTSAAIVHGVAPAGRAQARQDLAAVTAFNIVTAGLDAHAKNFALLHIGARPALAPFYDLTSTALLYPPSQVAYQGRYAMAIGGERQPHAIRPHHIDRAAADLQVTATAFTAEIRRHVTEVPAAIVQAIDEAGPLIASATAERLHARITGWLNLLDTGLSPSR
ncbi:MAG: HipA domain-containing protein [Bifidobacteriaceae bacterium]|nr:HipA domain-containing protein [Bifidobacteriaceae bacterium]